MQRERHTVDQLFSNKIDKFNKNDKLRIEKYYGKIEEYKQKLNEKIYKKELIFFKLICN